MIKTDSQCENQCFRCTIQYKQLEDKEGNVVKIGEVFKKIETDKWPDISLCVGVCVSASLCVCDVCVISVLGNNTEGESERLHRPH